LFRFSLIVLSFCSGVTRGDAVKYGPISDVFETAGRPPLPPPPPPTLANKGASSSALTVSIPSYEAAAEVDALVLQIAAAADATASFARADADTDGDGGGDGFAAPSVSIARDALPTTTTHTFSNLKDECTYVCRLVAVQNSPAVRVAGAVSAPMKTLEDTTPLSPPPPPPMLVRTTLTSLVVAFPAYTTQCDLLTFECAPAAAFRKGKPSTADNGGGDGSKGVSPTPSGARSKEFPAAAVASKVGCEADFDGLDDDTAHYVRVVAARKRYVHPSTESVIVLCQLLAPKCDRVFVNNCRAAHSNLTFNH
jgi:hypothetical protein